MFALSSSRTHVQKIYTSRNGCELGRVSGTGYASVTLKKKRSASLITIICELFSLSLPCCCACKMCALLQLNYARKKNATKNHLLINCFICRKPKHWLGTCTSLIPSLVPSCWLKQHHSRPTFICCSFFTSPRLFSGGSHISTDRQRCTHFECGTCTNKQKTHTCILDKHLAVRK